MIFADTSFLVSLYIDEKRSPIARDYTEKAEERLVFTPFHRLELRTALRLRVFRGEITHNQLRRSFQLIESDLQEGMLQHASYNWTDALRQAEEIAEAHPGPVRTKRWVALPEVCLSGEATKPGYTLCGLAWIRQRSQTDKERQPFGRGSLGRDACVAHSVK